MRKGRIFRAAAVCAAAAAALAFAGCDNPAGGNGNGGGWTPPGIGLWVYGTTGTTPDVNTQHPNNDVINHVNNNPGTRFVLAMNNATILTGTAALTLAPDTNLTIVSIGVSGTRIEFGSGGGTSARLFTVGNRATLTLGDNITLQGRPPASDHRAALIRVENGGRLNMRGNSIITGHTNNNNAVLDNYNGAAIHIAAGGTLDMSGTARIHGNRQGGVYLTTGSHFDRTGWTGTIDNNWRGTGTATAANVIMHASHSLFSAINADSRITGNVFNPAP